MIAVFENPSLSIKFGTLSACRSLKVIEPSLTAFLQDFLLPSCMHVLGITVTAKSS